MEENSAPGPDGFSVTFYKKCWGIVKADLMDMINDFYLGYLDIGRLNYGVITLISKVASANNIKQYRPICLLNVSFKIFTGLIMIRLNDYAGGLISRSQTTFIKGRYIIDGAVILHKVMHELKTKQMRAVIFKIDFEKAYDNVRWGFVEEVLTQKDNSTNKVG
jgi:mannosylglycoprotein endo-beta-mannosidase